MDLTTRKHGSRRHNFTLFDGSVVDVVTRRLIHDRWYPDLAVPIDTRGKVDAWVLCVWFGDEYEPEFAGWIPEDRGVKVAEVKQFHERGVKNFVVRIEQLAPIRYLKHRHNPDLDGAEPIPDGFWELFDPVPFGLESGVSVPPSKTPVVQYALEM